MTRTEIARDRLIALVIDVGMLRRDVATDIVDAIMTYNILIEKPVPFTAAAPNVPTPGQQTT